MKHILIIEDDEQVRAFLGEMLRREGYEVAEASDGKAGMKAFIENPAQLVITDIFMPEKEGLEVIRELKRDFPETNIIAISGGGFQPETYLYAACKLGANRTFLKPVERKKLVEAVNELLI
ncbi:MAG: response regulator [Desulfobacterales bacterium]|nr:response regulator [Desulfobacterales bacterium]